MVASCEEYVITLLPEFIHDLTKQSNMRRIAEVDPDPHVFPPQEPPTAGAWSPEPYGIQKPPAKQEFLALGYHRVYIVRASLSGSSR